MKATQVLVAAMLAATCCSSAMAQAALTSSTLSNSSATVIPNIIKFSDSLPDRQDQKLTLSYSFYKESKGGDPLWTETHEVTLSNTGTYTVLLGSQNALPAEIFVDGQARWIGVTPSGEPERDRVLMTATAYAVKAGDAETLGGLPSSAYLRAGDSSKDQSQVPFTTGGTITGVKAGYGLTGGGTSGTVTLSLNTATTNSLYSGLNVANTFSQPQTITTSALTGLIVNDTGSSSTGIYANATGANGKGLYANAKGTAVTGFTSATSTTVQNAGVLGKVGPLSAVGAALGVTTGVGAWGDGGKSNSGLAVLGTVDNGVAGRFESNTSNYVTTYIHNANPNGFLFAAVDGSGNSCQITSGANLTCTGSVQTVSHLASGRHVATYSTQAAEDWSEDAGSAKLANGATHVNLDPAFVDTVNTAMEYHVFLTPDGDSKGIYVAAKTPTGFDVKEMNRGKSSISFDYRIMAKRRGHETERLADVTDQMQKISRQSANFSPK